MQVWTHSVIANGLQDEGLAGSGVVEHLAIDY